MVFVLTTFLDAGLTYQGISAEKASEGNPLLASFTAQGIGIFLLGIFLTTALFFFSLLVFRELTTKTGMKKHMIPAGLTIGAVFHLIGSASWMMA